MEHTFSFTLIVKNKRSDVKYPWAAGFGVVRLGREPLGEFTDLGGHPLEALSIRDQEGSNDEDGKTELSHVRSIALTRRCVARQDALPAPGGPTNARRDWCG